MADTAARTDLRELGSRRELFVDYDLIDHLDGAALKLHEPTPAEVAIRIDRPWEGPFNAGFCVIHHQGVYRLYYRALHGPEPFKLCYAESTDGVLWTKPNLGLVDSDGSTANNILASDIANFDLFLDTCPGVPDAERFKMAQYYVQGQRITPYFAGEGGKEVYLLVSEDGLRFREASNEPILRCDWPNAFDSQNVFFWSEAERQYVCYFRFMDPLRTMARITSPDLQTWSEPVAMTYGDTPREELYTNATQPYFRAPHLYIALPARFMPGRQVVTDEELAGMSMATVGKHVYHNDCSDGVFMTTRAGSTQYDRPFMETYVRPGLGSNHWISRTNYPIHGLVQTGPEELSFYVTREYAQPTWHIRRYTLRVDGFSSVNAPYRGGELHTKPLTFTGNGLAINFRTGAAGGVRVELQDREGRPLPGYSLTDCDELIGDAINRVVTWNGSRDVAPLAGTPIRLRFVMRDADLYALRFGDD